MSKQLLSKVHEQCEVWKEQAETSQKNLQSLRLRSSEEIQQLHKTLNEGREAWKKAQAANELEILRVTEEGQANIREKNVRVWEQ